MLRFVNQINKAYSITLTPAIFYTYHNLYALTQHLIDKFSNLVINFYQKDQSINTSALNNTLSNIEPLIPLSQKYKSLIVNSTSKNKDLTYEPIAIVGIHGIFPKSQDPEEFWEHLQLGTDLITEIPIERWDWHKYYSSTIQDSNKTNSKWGGFIDDIDKFDPEFFNISPLEAELMDPQHRLFLITVWKALEDSGYDPYKLPTQDIGLFAGVQFNEYKDLITKTNKLHAYSATGNSHAMLANRVSYLLNLTGPSEAIDTACSSSLIAIHRAVRALHDKECTLAIAGGVSLIIDPQTFVLTSSMGILSSDGKCKTFDKNANGYVKGEGIGAVILKPLSKAQEDKNTIYGVIKGSSVNHGGKAQSITAPNSIAQAQLLEKAFISGNINPETITYIETHGTGTALGDPIEIEGLKLAFNKFSETNNKNNYCGLGSVKTNIGHLEPAAGIAGIIKVLMSFKYKQLPGIVNFHELNPYIDLKNTPFYIIEKTCDWKRLKDDFGVEIPRRAGVSSFGFGGANAHIILEEASESLDAVLSQTKPYYLVTLSAKTDAVLQQKIIDLNTWLNKHCKIKPQLKI